MNVVLAVVIAVVLASVPGVRFGETSTRVVQVLPDSPAEKAGIQVGDRIVAVRGHAVETLSEMQTEIQIASDTETEFLVERGSQTNCVLIAVARDEITEGCYIGAVMTNESGAVSWMPARNPLKQLAWDAGSIFRVLKGLVNPEEAKATSRALGGPVMIAEGLYRQVRRDPWDGLGFLRFLNVNLAVLNLLPIPVLDGGLIVFALFALVFRRRVPAFIVKYLSLAFMVALMGLMGLLILRDSWRSYKIHTCRQVEEAEKAEEVEKAEDGAANATSQDR